MAHYKSYNKVRCLCMDCGEVFNKKSQLTIHQRNHTAQKPYQCIECGETFAQKSQLTTQQRTYSVEKPYSFYECYKIFSRKSLLIQHQKIHTGEKPMLVVCVESLHQETTAK